MTTCGYTFRLGGRRLKIIETKTTERRKEKKRKGGGGAIKSHNWNSLGFQKLITLDPVGFTMSLEIRYNVSFVLGFPDGSVVKNPPANV